ncbi:hypothetical protein D3C81_859810 [compost metagenome]
MRTVFQVRALAFAEAEPLAELAQVERHLDAHRRTGPARLDGLLRAAHQCLGRAVAATRHAREELVDPDLTALPLEQAGVGHHLLCVLRRLHAKHVRADDVLAVDVEQQAALLHDEDLAAHAQDLIQLPRGQLAEFLVHPVHARLPGLSKGTDGAARRAHAPHAHRCSRCARRNAGGTRPQSMSCSVGTAPRRLCTLPHTLPGVRWRAHQSAKSAGKVPLPARGLPSAGAPPACAQTCTLLRRLCCLAHQSLARLGL